MDAFEVACVEPKGLIFAESYVYVYPFISQQVSALAGDLFEGVQDCDFDTGNARLENRIGAGGCFAIMTARLKSYVQSGAAGIEISIFAVEKGIDFGVVLAITPVVSLTYNLVASGEDCTYLGIWRNETSALTGQLKCKIHKDFGIIFGHRGIIADPKRIGSDGMKNRGPILFCLKFM